MMHKQIFRTAMALAAAGLAAQAAHAQSSVTLYGIVDAGFTFTNNQKGDKRLSGDAGQCAGFALGPARHGRSGRRQQGDVQARKRFQPGIGRVGSGRPDVRP
jgi:predicted porin